jgi:type I restriction enzyme S subunit
MKDSGIEWLGEIPAHWEVRKLGWALRFISYGFTSPMPTTYDGPFMLTANDIGDGVIRYGSARRTDPTEMARLTRKCLPQRGDILVTKDGTLGRIAVADGQPACINQSVAVLTSANTLGTTDFIQNALRSEAYQARMLFEAGGTTIKHIYVSRLAQMPFAFPPLREQSQICDFVNQARPAHDALIQGTARSLDRLREYRQALITAAVTGQLDIPDTDAEDAA